MNKKFIITVISDTHCKHNQITKDLLGGCNSILLHAGDSTSMGYVHETFQFCDWFDRLHQYDNKIFIAGNHDWLFQTDVKRSRELVDCCKNITYLEDDLHLIGEEYDDYSNMVKVYGTPWQPEFYNWAFNLPRNGEQMQYQMSLIPDNTDILITHGPAYGILDTTEWDRSQHLGCEILSARIAVVKPKIHVCGHIHSGNGYYFDGTTHFFNAAVLGEKYTYQYKPLTFIWDKDTNEIQWL
jgi:predicted phosphodiesterase